jgi:phage shock protein A
MSFVRRVVTSVYARVDHLVGEIENHDALISAAIREQRRKIAAARLQYRHIQGAEQRLGTQLARLGTDDRLWTRRAQREAAQDEEKALACLARRNKLREQSQRLVQMQRQYQDHATRMQADIARCEHDLEMMIQKHAMLRARQSTAEALQTINDASTACCDEIQTSFDRWELRIAEGESTVDRYEEGDELERAYLDEEMRQRLREELAQLMSAPTGTGETQ